VCSALNEGCCKIDEEAKGSCESRRPLFCLSGSLCTYRYSLLYMQRKRVELERPIMPREDLRTRVTNECLKAQEMRTLQIGGRAF
jgi:hypothetical protein